MSDVRLQLREYFKTSDNILTPIRINLQEYNPHKDYYALYENFQIIFKPIYENYEKAKALYRSASGVEILVKYYNLNLLCGLEAIIYTDLLENINTLKDIESIHKLHTKYDALIKSTIIVEHDIPIHQHVSQRIEKIKLLYASVLNKYSQKILQKSGEYAKTATPEALNVLQQPPSVQLQPPRQIVPKPAQSEIEENPDNNDVTDPGKPDHVPPPKKPPQPRRSAPVLNSKVENLPQTPVSSPPQPRRIAPVLNREVENLPQTPVSSPPKSQFVSLSPNSIQQMFDAMIKIASAAKTKGKTIILTLRVNNNAYDNQLNVVNVSNGTREIDLSINQPNGDLVEYTIFEDVTDKLIKIRFKTKRTNSVGFNMSQDGGRPVKAKKPKRASEPKKAKTLKQASEPKNASRSLRSSKIVS